MNEFYRHNSTFKVKPVKLKARTALKRGKGKLRPMRKAEDESQTQKLERQLDDVVSKLVRALFPFCVLCGESDSTKLSCGHFWKRFRRPTRWHLDNLATLCLDCNARDNEIHEPFTIWIFEKLGERRFDELAELAHCNKVFNQLELEEMLTGLKQTLAELRKAA